MCFGRKRRQRASGDCEEKLVGGTFILSTNPIPNYTQAVLTRDNYKSTMQTMIVIDWATFGERVMLARRRRKLTLSELGAQIGVSRNTLNKIESGVTAPSYAIIMSLCAVLDVVEPPYQVIDRLADAEQQRQQRPAHEEE